MRRYPTLAVAVALGLALASCTERPARPTPNPTDPNVIVHYEITTSLRGWTPHSVSVWRANARVMQLKNGRQPATPGQVTIIPVVDTRRLKDGTYRFEFYVRHTASDVDLTQARNTPQETGLRIMATRNGRTEEWCSDTKRFTNAQAEGMAVGCTAISKVPA